MRRPGPSVAGSGLLLLLCLVRPPAAAGAPPSAGGAAWGQQVDRTCLSRDCDDRVNWRHLADLASHMKPSADPCDDFHEYACAHWARQHSPERTAMRVGEKQLTERYIQLFQQLLTPDPSPSPSPDPIPDLQHLRRNAIFVQMTEYYRVCRASGAEQPGGVTWGGYVAEMRAQGLWRLEAGPQWLETLAQMGRYVPGRHFVQVHLKQLNATHFVLSVEPHEVGERLALDEEVYEALRPFTARGRAALAEDFRRLEASLEDVVGAACANAVTDAGGECDLTESLTYRELLRRSKSLDWPLLLADAQLAADDVLQVSDLRTIEKTARLLDERDRPTLFLYTLARFVSSLRQLPHSVVRDGCGPHTCVRHMLKVHYLPMMYLYERAFYGRVRAESDRVIRAVFGRLKEEFGRTLTRNAMQLGAESVLFLRRKLEAMRLNVGNLPPDTPDQFFADYTHDLNVSDNFYRNHLAALRHYYRRQALLSSRARLPEAWLGFNMHSPYIADSLDSTPYYYCLSNVIVLPYAYLQTPFYDRRFWPALLYGDLANTLAHELMHAFDQQFLQYDAVGNQGEQHEAIVSNANFVEGLECLARRPTDFLAERIADVSGTRLALDAFMGDARFRRRNGRLYFLQFAQFFCGDADGEHFARHDPSHDVDSVRLNYTLAQTAEFAEVFDCAPGSPMNPAEKCRLW